MRSEIRSELSSMFAKRSAETPVRIDENDKNAFEHIVLHKNNVPDAGEMKFASNKLQLDEKKDELKLEGLQKDIADVLSKGALNVDDLAQHLGIDPAELVFELSEMELLGAVRMLPGKIYEKC